MDPLSVATVGALYVATSVARKAGDDLVDQTWVRIKKAIKSVLGREAEPSDVTATSIESAVAADPELEDALRQLWAGDKVLRRAQLIEQALDGARVLWIDDHPEWNVIERDCFAALGMRVTTVESTRSALACLDREPFDFIVSDIARDSSNSSGLDALPDIKNRSNGTPVILYVGAVEPRGVPPGAFGITARPDELLHLCMDVLERQRL
jgi:CheY-like chemotaxis protein